MDDNIHNVLADAQLPFGDARFNVCRLEAEGEDGRYRLRGTVLDQATLTSVLQHLTRQLPDAGWNADSVQVLRQSNPHLKRVTTNMTGFQRDPTDEAFLLPLIERARGVLGRGTFERAERDGRALTYEQGIDETRNWLMRAQ